MTFRFLHASDLHLGKPFGGYPEGIRNRLREARHAAIGRLAQAARQGGAQVVLLAGDSFDAETPAPDTLRQALRAMAEEADIRWIMLPGNHDSLAASELWRRIATDGPAASFAARSEANARCPSSQAGWFTPGLGCSANRASSTSASRTREYPSMKAYNFRSRSSMTAM